MGRGCTCFLYFPQIFKWALFPERSHADHGLKYFRLLAESAVDICRPFLYTVLVVSVFFTNSAYNKKWDRQPLRESLSLFSLGLFCNSPLFLLILRDFYKPSSGSRKSIFILLLQSSSFLNIGSAASFLRFPAPHWHSGAEPMHRNMLLVHLV